MNIWALQHPRTDTRDIATTSSPPHQPPRLTIPTDQPSQSFDFGFDSSRNTETTPNSALQISPAAMPAPIIHPISNGVSWSYVVADPVSEQAVIINPALSYDEASNRIATTSADSILKLIEGEGYSVNYILETGIRRHHLSACRYLRDKLAQTTGNAPKICIGRNLDRTRGDLSPDRDSPERVSIEDNAFDKLWADSERFRLGNLIGEVLYLFPTTIGYVFGSNIFTSVPRGVESLPLESRERLLELSFGYKVYGLHHPDSFAAFITIAQIQQFVKDANLEGKEPPPSPSSEPESVLQFYARIVNSKAGRIPRRINLTFPGMDKGKQKEIKPKPLLIPKKLEMLLC